MLDYRELTKALGELEEERVYELLKDFVAKNPSEEESKKAILACQDGMAVVGELYEKGEYFVSDLIFAGEILTQATEILKSVLGGGSSETIGTIVLGTVAGDLHDIGKNIFKVMAEAAGFKVYDLGVDQSPEAFAEAVKRFNADIVGLSGVLTLALQSMKDIVAYLVKEGLRDKVKVIIGGNPVTKEACEDIGADYFTQNAAEGVTVCKKWVS